MAKLQVKGNVLIPFNRTIEVDDDEISNIVSLITGTGCSITGKVKELAQVLKLDPATDFVSQLSLTKVIEQEINLNTD